MNPIHTRLEKARYLRLRLFVAAFFMLVLSTVSSFAQTLSQYTFQQLSGTYTPITTGGGAVTSTATGDDGRQTLTIPFTFNYLGNAYTSLSVCTNGWASLTDFTSVEWTNNLNSGTPRNALAPFWDDMQVLSGSILYQTLGTAPNRTFVIQWTNVEWPYLSGIEANNFQLRLIENGGAANRIEFHYGSNNAGGGGSVSIGLSATGTGAGNFLSVTPATGGATFSTTTENNAINTITGLASGTIFRMEPPVAVAFDAEVTSVSAPNLSNTSVPVRAVITNRGGTALSSVQLNWTINGVAQTPVTFSTTAALAQNATATVNLGNRTFTAAPVTITVSVIPTTINGSNTDQNALNNTSSTVLTSLMDVAPLPYAQGFETSEVPQSIMPATPLNCLRTVDNISGTASWRRNDASIFSASGISGVTNQARTGSFSIRFNSYNGSSGGQGGFDIIANMSLPATLSFWQLTGNSASGAGSNLDIQISSDGVNFTTIQTYTGKLTAWTQRSISLGATGITYIRFRGTADWWNDILIDDITLIPPPQANDVALRSLVSPTLPLVAGLAPVTVTMQNNGTNVVSSVVLNWAVNGQDQTPVTISNLAVAPGASTNLSLGSFNFQSNIIYSLVITAATVNAVSDPLPSDNTIRRTLRTPLNGTYTIAPTGGDYPNFTTAVNDLVAYGVSGPVTFNVLPGTYTEQVVIPEISGANATNRITFNGTAGAVMTFGGNVSGSNYLIRLNSADFITIQNMTFNATNISFSRVIEILSGANGANENRILNNTMNGPVTTSITTEMSNIFASVAQLNTFNSNLVISGNTLNNNSYSVYIGGWNSVDAMPGLQFVNNQVVNYYYSGLYLFNANAPTINQNIIRTNSTYTFVYPIYLSSCNGATSVQLNQVFGGQGGYGIYVISCSGNASAPFVVANNMVSIGSNLATPASNTAVAFFATSSNNINIYFNSFLTRSGSTGTNYPVYISAGSNLRMLNNNLVNLSTAAGTTGNGALWCTWSSGTSPLVQSDYNNFFFANTSTTPAAFTYTVVNGATFTTTYFPSLQAWQNASGFDGNSFGANPNYASDVMTTGNLRITDAAAQVQFAGRGIAIPGYTVDIDGQTRSQSPVPGCDEFFIPGVDAAISWIAPMMPAASGNNNVTVQIRNTRTDAITSVQVTYGTTTGTILATQTFNLSPALAGGGTRNVTFTTPYNLTGPVELIATILTVNGAADSNPNNNTTAVVRVRPALAGPYTVGAGGAFASMAAATQELSLAGISAPVFFNVLPGTYVEQVVLPVFASITPTHRVTVQSSTGNPADVTFQPAQFTSSALNYIFRLIDNAQNYTINALTLTIPNVVQTVGAYGVELRNNVSNVTISNNVIDMKKYSTSTAFRGITSNPAPSFQSNIQILNNTFIGGYYSMYLFGIPNAESNFTITGNDCRDFYVFGLWMNGLQNTLVSQNQFRRPGRSASPVSPDIVPSSYYGIFMTTINRSVTMERNVFNTVQDPNVATLGSYFSAAIQVGSVRPPAGQENIFRNNLIYNLNTLGTVYTIDLNGTDGFLAYHNTISLSPVAAMAGQTVGFMFRPTTPNGLRNEFRNNIVSIQGVGSGLNAPVWNNAAGNSSNVLMNNNLYFVNVPTSAQNFGGIFGGLAYPLFSDFQLVSGQDAGSIFADPLFFNVAAYDLRIPVTSPAAKRFNLGIASVTRDYNNALRSTLFADWGALISPSSLAITGSLAFGNVGNAQSRTLQLVNTSGNDPISLTGVTLTSGAQSGLPLNGPQSGFRVSGLPTTYPSTLAANGSYNVTVQYADRAYSPAGTVAENIVIANNSAQPVVSLPMSGYYATLQASDAAGNSVLTSAQAPTANLEVGTGEVGQSLPPRTLVLSTGPVSSVNLSVPITINTAGVTITGADASLFSVVTAIPSQLNGSQSISIAINTNGISPGAKEAFLNIPHTGQNGPVTTIRLTASIGRPTINAPTIVNLPDAFVNTGYAGPYSNVAYIPLRQAGIVAVDMCTSVSDLNTLLPASLAQAVEFVSNSGLYLIRGRQNVVTGGFEPDGDVANVNTWLPFSGTRITTTQPILIAVRMKNPAAFQYAVGAYSGQIMLSNGSGNCTGTNVVRSQNSIVITLVGQLIDDPSRLPLYPLLVDFGSVPVGVTNSRNITVRNTSQSAGNVTLSLTGTAYSFVGGLSQQTFFMNAGESRVVELRFTPPNNLTTFPGTLTASGAITGTITIAGNGLASSTTDLDVFVDGQVWTASSGILDFGNIVVGQSASRTILLRNNGIVPITVSNIFRSSNSFGNSPTQFNINGFTAPVTLVPNGGQATFTLSFNPTSVSPAQKDAAIIIQTSAINRSIDVRGTAINAGGNVASFVMTPPIWNYGSVAGSRDFVLTNNGAIPFRISSSLILPASANFTITNQPAANTVVAPGQSVNYTVAFNTTGTVGQRSSNLLVLAYSQDNQGNWTTALSPFPSALLQGNVPNPRLGGAVTGEANGLSLVGAFPNPASSVSAVRFTLAQSTESAHIRIVDALGREVASVITGTLAAGEQEIGIPVENLSNGSYRFTVEANGLTVSGSIVIVK